MNKLDYIYRLKIKKEMAEKDFQKRQDSPTLKPNNQRQEFKLQKRKEKLMEILQAKRHPKKQSKDMISTSIGNITRKRKSVGVVGRRTT